MKFVLTGGAGNVTSPLAETLLAEGHAVTVIGRNPKNLAALVARGATAAIGDLADIAFLTETFRGSDGVYLMIPPSWNAASIKQTSIDLAKGFAEAIRASGVRHAVFLSSYGAHRLHDAGAISGMGLAEEVLNGLDGVQVLHLRTGYFYSNLLLSIGLVRSSGVMGNMFEVPPGKFTVVEPAAIAQVAANALVKRDFEGHSFRWVISDVTGTDEIAALLGKEIGIPDLRWVRFSPAEFEKTLLGYGFSAGAAKDYLEMFGALDSGSLFEDWEKRPAPLVGATIEEFAKTFAEAYAKGSDVA